jgi:hypothetical protein
MNSLFDFTVDICIECDDGLIPLISKLTKLGVVNLHFAYSEGLLNVIDVNKWILYLSPNSRSNFNMIALTHKQFFHDKNYRRKKCEILEEIDYSKILLIRSTDQLNQFLVLQSLGFTKFEDYIHLEDTV